ncbi:cathepsin B isoform X3 [Tetranychus urticae]|uniref:Peptidase C1A papain C-terminal domain-containing protein n=1 Tax=Tetranychus urticae TaxID=32264 RepID=T1KZF1_TETUR|nr:cathepsin B isoform X2 [Tetranychus urticae]XP_025017977.1 cathepsin B isoform X3 [Tetranychus urticae]
MIKVLFLILLSSNLAELKAVERVFLDPGIDPLSDEMVNAINSLNTTWKAKRNFVGVSFDYVKGLLGVAPDDISLPEADIQIAEDIPESFDARKAWANCTSISNIRDQGVCGSCWAFGAVEAMSDRICIASGGNLQVELSAEDLLSCCSYCGRECSSGRVARAWDYWEFNGIVTGGAFAGAGCKPYKYAPCEHNTAGLTLSNCSSVIPEKPVCVGKCQPDYNKSYEDDKYYGKNIRNIGGARRVEKIQTEIMTNGPVEATFIVYSDFPSYSSGVYQHHSRVSILEHAIRILGWGVEDGVDYWLVANSWNTYWGDQGYFKIRRGINECNIEDKVYAGTPDFSRP